MSRRREWRRAPAVGLLVVAVAGCSEAQTGDFETLMGYWVAEGGGWRMDNEEYVQGGEAPMYWGRTFAWGADRTSVTSTSYAVTESGCTLLLTLEYTPDSVPGRAVLKSVGGPLQGEGLLEPSGSDQVTQTTRARRPDGTTMEFRDRMDRADRNAYVIAGQILRDGEWQPTDTATWVRDPAQRGCETG